MDERAEVQTGNLFENLPGDLAVELFTDIASAPGVRIERIVSSGHATPEGEWYDQPQDEWVVVLKGKARLGFEDGTALDMAPGDHALIPARRRHRVEWTSPREPTVWLAVHYGGGGAD
jgi:cupin 2 domain-containing protein